MTKLDLPLDDNDSTPIYRGEKLDLPLDDILAGDGCESDGHFGHAYWVLDKDGISVCAHVYFKNRTPEEEEKIANASSPDCWVTPPILPEKCFWYFADNISLPYTMECGLRTFGLRSTDEVDVHIMLDDGTGEVFHLPYIENPNPEFALQDTAIETAATKKCSPERETPTDSEALQDRLESIIMLATYALNQAEAEYAKPDLRSILEHHVRDGISGISREGQSGLLL